MTPRRTREQLRIVDRDGCDAFVRSNMGLISVALRANFPWLMSQFRALKEDIEAVAMVSLMKAFRDHDPERGRPATQAVTYITNDLTNWLKKRRTKKARGSHNVDSIGVYVAWQRTPLAQAIHDEEERRNTTLDLFGDVE